jgi:hypothetical protein
MLIIVLNTEARESLSLHVNTRLLVRIAEFPTTDDRLFTLKRLIMELLPVIIITLVSLILFRIKKINQKGSTEFNQLALLFILIGLSGSLPLMLTMVQRGFYFSHCLPFFAIGFALLVAPGINELMTKIDTKRKGFLLYKYFSVLLLISSIVFSAGQVGKISRNRDLIRDARIIGEEIPPYSDLRSDHQIWNNWDLQSYLIRHYNISLYNTDDLHQFYLTQKNGQVPEINIYEKTGIVLRNFDLYRLKQEDPSN